MVKVDSKPGKIGNGTELLGNESDFGISIDSTPNLKLTKINPKLKQVQFITPQSQTS